MSVLFNFNKCCIWINGLYVQWFAIGAFNFNKCCIWILYEELSKQDEENLTLTSVVFELSFY